MHKMEIQSDKLFVIEDFLSAQECETCIRESESFGFTDAPITTFLGAVMCPEVRNNTRVMIDDDFLAHRLFERAQPFLPAMLHGWKIAGFNERFRFYRYRPGQKFAPHFDGPFCRSNHEMSMLTFILYLNDGFSGGGTRFFDDPDTVIKPKRGMALVFVHRKKHEGQIVLAGTKYVLRTDVMYKFVA